MSYAEIRERLQEKAAAAAVRDNVIRFRPDPSPCPGDTFSLPGLSGVPAELVIVERDPQDVRRLRAVVLDDYPQIGSTDVELHLGEPGRIANIRCDLDAWLDVSRFPTASRTGSLPPESLAEIHSKRGAIAAGDVRPSLHEEEVEGDPEYRRWKDETLRGVLSTLDQPQALPRRLWPRYLSAAAAAALLAVAGVWGFRHVERLQDGLAARTAEVTRLEEASSGLSERLTAANRGLEEMSEDLLERTAQVVDLERRIESLGLKAMEPNLPFAFLSFGDGSDRHAEYTLLLPEDAGRVALVFEVVDPELYSHYGLRITEQGTGKEIWTNDELQRRAGVVSLGLPASILPSRDYIVVVSGYEEGKATPLDERYLLHVRRPGEW